MRTSNGQSPVNGSLTQRHDEDVPLSNPSSTNSNKDGFRNVVVQSNSTPIRTFIRTSQGQLLLVAAQPALPAAISNVAALPFSQNNVAVPIQIPQIVGSSSTSVAAVPPDPIPPVTPVLRHPTPPPAFASSPAVTPQPQQLSSSTASVGAQLIGQLAANELAASPVVGQNVSGSSTPTATAHQQGSQISEADKKKCISFLRTLLRLAKDKGGGSLMTEVSELVSGILANRISPQMFTDKIQAVLSSKPQPHLLPFLESMLPHVRQSFYAGEFTLEDLDGPSANSVSAQRVSSPVRSQPLPRHQASTLVASSSASSLNNLGTNTTVMMAAPIAGPYLVAAPGVVRGVMPNVNQQTTLVRNHYPAVAQQLTSGGANASLSTPSGLVYRSPMLSRAPMPSTSYGPPGTSMTTGTSARAPRPSGKVGGSFAGHQQGSLPASATPDKYREPEDDINDVAAMGGVNLAEESQKIMASTTEILSTETRSCGKDEDFLSAGPLALKVRTVLQKHGLQESRPELLSLLSQATRERLKDLLEKLALIAEHRAEPLRVNPLYEQVTDVRSQLRFLEDLSKKDFLRREEREKEMVLKMARSRSSKLGDTEQQRMKERAKELQKAEQEEVRNRDANAAAQLALASSRKRPAAAMSSTHNSGDTQNTSNLSSSGPSNVPEALVRTQIHRPRYKRVNLRDLQLLLSQEREARRSTIFYRSFYK